MAHELQQQTPGEFAAHRLALIRHRLKGGVYTEDMTWLVGEVDRMRKQRAAEVIRALSARDEAVVNLEEAMGQAEKYRAALAEVVEAAIAVDARLKMIGPQMDGDHHYALRLGKGSGLDVSRFKAALAKLKEAGL